MSKQIQLVRDALLEAKSGLDNLIENEAVLAKVVAASELMLDSIKSGHKVMSCGNGGSLCDAMHFAEELSGRFRKDRPAIAAMSLADPSHMSCVGNDYGYVYVFSRFLSAVGQKGDTLLAITTSGTSKNIVKAAEEARKKASRLLP